MSCAVEWFACGTDLSKKKKIFAPLASQAYGPACDIVKTIRAPSSDSGIVPPFAPLVTPLHAGLPFSDFNYIQIAHQKHIRTIKTKKACVNEQILFIWIETVIEYWFVCSSKFNFAALTYTFGRPFFSQEVFHRAGNTIRWRYLPLIVWVHLLLKLGNFVKSSIAARSKVPEKIEFQCLLPLIETCFF